MRTIGPLHFEDLEPRRFEDLVRQLLYDFKDWRALESTGRSGADEGFDARGQEKTFDVEATHLTSEIDPSPASEGRVWLIQCKREAAIGPAKLVQYLNSIPCESIVSIYGIVFVAACNFSLSSRQAFRAWSQNNGISEAFLWGRGEIEDQVFQPKNDNLLFAYFGISLSIRRQTFKTQLRARLATKKRCLSILDRNRLILIRDPTDDRYPFFDGVDDLESLRWRVRTFTEHYHAGITLLIRRHFGYVSDDRKNWDKIEEIDDATHADWDDPWHGRAHTTDDDTARAKVVSSWNELPPVNRAWVEVLCEIKYDDILAIDEDGDDFARMPHIYVDTSNGISLEKIEFDLHSETTKSLYVNDETRVQFFDRSKSPANVGQKS